MPTGVISTGNFPRALFPGVKKWYQTAYNEYGEECKELFEFDTSSQAYELDVGFVGTGLAPVKPQGQAVTFDSMEAGFEARFTHVTYGLGIIITKEEYDDNLYPKLIKKRGTALARSLRQTKENVGANIYNRMFNASFPGADGVSILNASHPNKAGGTFSNVLSVAADLAELSLEQACIDISKFNDDRGLRIQAKPMTLHVAPDNQFTAERILKSVLQNDTGNNAVNALRSMGIIPGGTKVNHYFTDLDAWFLRTDVPDGMKAYQRQKHDMQMDNDSDTFNAKYIASERYSFGNSDPRGIFGSAGA